MSGSVPQLGAVGDPPACALDADGRYVWVAHDCDDREVGPATDPRRSKAMLPINPGRWTVIQSDPITVVPSVLCRACGWHVFITNGEIVEA